MNAGNDMADLDKLISRSIGRDDLQFDFDKWKQAHEEQIQIYQSTAASGALIACVRGSTLWRYVMRSRFVKLGAAALIVAAVVIGIGQFGGPIAGATVAVADVVEPLLRSETGRFKMTLDLAAAGVDWADVGDDPVQTVDVRFSGPARTRWDFPAGEVLIVNFDQGKLMILIPQKSQASVMQIGPPGTIPPHNRFNALMAIRPLIGYALEIQDEAVECLGQRQVEGVNAVGYHMTGPAHHGDITVWADAATGELLSVERAMKQQRQSVLLTKIAFDIRLDDSLFEVEPPQGYVLAASDADTEAGFVVRGTVTDAATGLPIPDARVSDDGYGPEPYRGATCDANGQYEYLTWAEEHGIVATAPGYKPQRKSLTGLFHVESGKEAVVDFVLERE